MTGTTINIVIAGPGAVGQVCGGKLSLAGNEVTFLARPGSDRIDQINRDGVRVQNLRDLGQSFVAQASAVASLEGARAADLVLLTTKTYSNAEVLPGLDPVVTDRTILLSLQNGVESAGQIREFFRRGCVLGAFCFMGAAVLPSGEVALNSPERVVIGDLDGRSANNVDLVLQAFQKARIVTDRSEDIQRALWIKLLWNVGIFQWCAIEDKTIGALLSNSDGIRKVSEAMAETVRVAQANGINLTEADIEPQIATALERYSPVTPSLLQDLRAGRPLEHHSFAGFVAREGKRLGIPTPINDQLLAALDKLTSKK